MAAETCKAQLVPQLGINWDDGQFICNCEEEGIVELAELLHHLLGKALASARHAHVCSNSSISTAGHIQLRHSKHSHPRSHILQSPAEEED